MKKMFCIICVMVFVCAMAITAVWAQDKKPDATKQAAAMPDAKDSAEFSKKADLFIQIASYGEANKDPLILISAVKLLDSLPFDGISKPGQDGKSGAKYDRVALLGQAKQYAAGDEELLAVIAKVQEPPEKTAVRGHGGHGGHHYGYYDRPHHRRHFDCTWFRVCHHHGGCNMVCR
ncbi:MAG: hypothetical protein C0392_01090 [Syntrophus sp. (in: bacteria)]|nr:hypothetical protein [Syntrophus sp. (in: bacteria)]